MADAMKACPSCGMVVRTTRTGAIRKFSRHYRSSGKICAKSGKPV